MASLVNGNNVPKSAAEAAGAPGAAQVNGVITPRPLINVRNTNSPIVLSAIRTLPLTVSNNGNNIYSSSMNCNSPVPNAVRSGTPPMPVGLQSVRFVNIATTPNQQQQLRFVSASPFNTGTTPGVTAAQPVSGSPVGHPVLRVMTAAPGSTPVQSIPRAMMTMPQVIFQQQNQQQNIRIAFPSAQQRVSFWFSRTHLIITVFVCVSCC